MSLRTMPPDQQIDRSRWRHLRYVPLSILAVLAGAAAIVGAVYAPTHPAIAPDGTRPATIDTSAPDAGTAISALPADCRQPVPAPETEPWLGTPEDRAAAQQVWDEHADELALPYVTGEDGWYDWGDVQANNLSQAVGKRVLTVDDAAAWHLYLSTLRDDLEAQGIPFYIVVAPAKWDVYPETLLAWAQGIRGSNSLDQMIALFPDLPIVDIRMPLRDASGAEAENTFSKTNSHWTDYGGLVAWDAISACLAADDPAFAGLTGPTFSGVDSERERNEFTPYGAPAGSADWTVPVYDPELKDVEVTDGSGTTTVAGTANTDMAILPAETRTEGSSSPLTALLVRDSFGNALSVPIQQVFATTWQVRHNFDDVPENRPDIAALAAQDKPDVVILEIAERHLNFPPGL